MQRVLPADGACVVKQNINPAVVLHHRAVNLFHRFHLGQIRPHRKEAAAQGLNQLLCFGDIGAVDCRDIRSGFRQPHRNGLANAVIGARYQSDFTL